MSVELRIRLTKGNIYAVQQKVPFLKRWHRWKIDFRAVVGLKGEQYKMDKNGKIIQL